MKTKRHTPGKIIAKMRASDAMLATIASLVQKLETCEQTFFAGAINTTA